MTYHPPYQPPQPGGPFNFDYYYQQQPDYLAPARRAANLLFVLGALAIISSFCCIGGGAMLPQLMNNPEFSSKMQSMPQGITPEMLRAGAIGFGVLSFACGVTYIILGVFVRRGSKGAAITGMVLSILAMLVLFIQMAGPFLTGQATADHALGACLFAIPLAMLALLVFWLVGAMKAAEQATAARYAMQYWQYAQQQQQSHGHPPQMPPPQPGPAEAGRPPDQPPPLPPQS